MCHCHRPKYYCDDHSLQYRHFGFDNLSTFDSFYQSHHQKFKTFKYTTANQLDKFVSELAIIF